MFFIQISGQILIKRDFRGLFNCKPLKKIFLYRFIYFYMYNIDAISPQYKTFALLQFCFVWLKTY